MEKIILNTASGSSEIRVGDRWTNLLDFVPSAGTVIITDENVFNIYGSGFPDFPVFAIPAGETSKNLKTIEDIAGRMLISGIDRSGFVLAIGGGVVCDIAGFVASVYMRGIRCGYVSTTLLSQVDASTGGKNGVDLGGAKNLLGTIRQPEFVICDTAMLSTLSDEEYLSGLVELIKTAVIGDKALFELIETQDDYILRRDPGLLESLVSASVRFKAAVVQQDETEKGLRRILNYGHTFGHALEMKLSLKHGFAVALGMQLAAVLSGEKGLARTEDTQRITRLLERFGLLKEYQVNAEEISGLIKLDKKKTGDKIDFVFNSGIGNAVTASLSVEELTAFYRKFTDRK